MSFHIYPVTAATPRQGGYQVTVNGKAAALNIAIAWWRHISILRRSWRASFPAAA